MDNKERAEKLKTILKLRGEPVAVKLIKEGDDMPTGYKVPEENTTHCVSIFKARAGETLLLPAEKHGCPVGASSLGLVETPEKVKDGRFHANIGMFEDAAKAKEMIDARYVYPGKVKATLVAPLKDAKFEPDSIVIADLPERIYWFVPAETYDGGGRINISTAAFQATCVDATLVPILEGKVNLTLGCYGCRRRTDIGIDEMIVGIPGDQVDRIIHNLEKLNEKPLQRAKRE